MDIILLYILKERELRVMYKIGIIDDSDELFEDYAVRLKRCWGQKPL